MTGGRTNWAGNIAFAAERFHRPATVEQVQEVVAGGRRVRALGTGHSFNRIADTSGDSVSVAGLPPTVDIDARRGTVTVAAGMRYGEVATRLHAAGHALGNLGSLPHISIAGACATGTHGSGDGNRVLPAAVSGMQLVAADGELVTVTRAADGDLFGGSVLALGALGVVTSLTLDIVPAFDVHQYVYDDLPWAELTTHWAEIFASGYSVSLFTDWSGPRINQVWLKRTSGEPLRRPPRTWLGATLAEGPRHPILGMPTHNCTPQLGAPGPWHTRLPHFRLEFTPSSGAELQSEYLVPRQHAVAALTAVDRIRDRVAAVLQISEIRTVAADDLWLSPAHRRDSLALHFTWISDTRAVTPVVALIESRLAPLGARPHWGKLFTTDPAVVSGLYDRFSDFRNLLADRDPAGKFRNDFVDRYFPASR